MFPVDKSILNRMEETLNRNCPSPENILIKLGEIAGHMQHTKESAKVRRFILDIDELISEIRWHLGQALLLMETQPYILIKGDNDSAIAQRGLLTSVQLLLRQFVRQPDKVFYDKLDEPRRGGTVAGWIFHMMIDSSVYRSIAVLDRIAHILWCAANLPGDRIYFRSEKVKRIHKSLMLPESQALVEIASGKLLGYLTSYRDNFTHNMKAYSIISGCLPIDDWISDSGKQIYAENGGLDAEMMFALGNAAYHQVLEVMKYFVSICEKKWPILRK